MQKAKKEETGLVGDITRLLKGAFEADVNLGATLKFDYGPEGTVFIDGRAAPNRVSNEDAPADCTVHVSARDHWHMLNMDMEQTKAFRQGKMRITGDPLVPLKLGPIVARYLEQQL